MRQAMQLHCFPCRLAVDAKVPELVTSIDEGVAAVSSLIEKEVQQGTPINKIIVGGCSVGIPLLTLFPLLP